MQTNPKTEIVFILDQSGSMLDLAADTVGGFNSTLSSTRDTEGEALVTTVLFNHKARTLHERIPIGQVPKMTLRDYIPAGSTALLDAVGETVEHISNIHRYARPEDVPERTVFFITTDGIENASLHFHADEVRQMIREKTEKSGWEFHFLAANIDAVSAAGSIGIPREHAYQVQNDAEGIARCYRHMAMAMCNPNPQRRREKK